VNRGGDKFPDEMIEMIASVNEELTTDEIARTASPCLDSDPSELERAIMGKIERESKMKVLASDQYLGAEKKDENGVWTPLESKETVTSKGSKPDHCVFTAIKVG